jgi:hypothetical protein
MEDRRRRAARRGVRRRDVDALARADDVADSRAAAASPGGGAGNGLLPPIRSRRRPPHRGRAARPRWQPRRLPVTEIRVESADGGVGTAEALKDVSDAKVEEVPAMPPETTEHRSPTVPKESSLRPRGGSKAPEERPPAGSGRGPGQGGTTAGASPGCEAALRPTARAARARKGSSRRSHGDHRLVAGPASRDRMIPGSRATSRRNRTGPRWAAPASPVAHEAAGVA